MTALVSKQTRRLLATTFAASVLVAGFAIPAEASMACGPHDKLIDTLKGKYKELRKGLGLIANQRVAEVYVSENGSWTFVTTHVNGISCILAAGHSWEDAPKVALIKPGI